jgi:hypothetical protein
MLISTIEQICRKIAEGSAELLDFIEFSRFPLVPLLGISCVVGADGGFKRGFIRIVWNAENSSDTHTSKKKAAQRAF